MKEYFLKLDGFTLSLDRRSPGMIEIFVLKIEGLQAGLRTARMPAAFSVVCDLDADTARLFQAVVDGTVFRTAEIYVQETAVQVPLKYLSLPNVRASSWRMNKPDSYDASPRTSAAFDSETVEIGFEYRLVGVPTMAEHTDPLFLLRPLLWEPGEVVFSFPDSSRDSSVPDNWRE